MSLEIIAKLICDGCGVIITGKVGRSSIMAKDSYYTAMKQAEKEHWLILPRYGKTKHLCQTCADGAPKPLPVAKG